MHMAYVVPHVSRLKLTETAMREKDKSKRQAILHELFDGYAATCDFPGMAFVDDLIEMYPKAKIVLNTRESAEMWKKSVENTVVYFSSQKYFWSTWLVPTDYWHHMNHRAYWDLARDRWGIEKWASVECYEKHNTWVREVAKKNGREVLEWKPEMGWGPLCNFLGKDVPQEPFPRLNEAAFIKKLIIILTVRGILAWVVAFSAPLVALYGIWWMRS